ncbi:DUF397 domain-containing protein [Amycolatopsis sp. lyj-112]|uniref:DUF397 domain-containing protein n=1 Tax=Amycolatopsis sp. lyj-112 TaxID=2789288 RepID=UPI00397DB749
MNDVTSSPTTKLQGGWFKSSYSSATGSCVEVRFLSDSILLRDSKDRTVDQPMIEVEPAGWSSFLKALEEPS